MALEQVTRYQPLKKFSHKGMRAPGKDNKFIVVLSWAGHRAHRYWLALRAAHGKSFFDQSGRSAA
jgi:hypothetical protein